jgi:hypothetical protein
MCAACKMTPAYVEHWACGTPSCGVRHTAARLAARDGAARAGHRANEPTSAPSLEVGQGESLVRDECGSLSGLIDGEEQRASRSGYRWAGGHAKSSAAGRSGDVDFIYDRSLAGSHVLAYLRASRPIVNRRSRSGGGCTTCSCGAPTRWAILGATRAVRSCRLCGRSRPGRLVLARIGSLHPDRPFAGRAVGAGQLQHAPHWRSATCGRTRPSPSSARPARAVRPRPATVTSARPLSSEGPS